MKKKPLSLILGILFLALAAVLIAYPIMDGKTEANLGSEIGFTFKPFFVNPPATITIGGFCTLIGIVLAVIGIAMVTSWVLNRLGIRAARHTTNGLIYVLLVAMSVIWLVPFFLILVESFREFPLHQVGDIFGTKPNPQEPIVWGIGNYTTLLNWEASNFLRWYVNTLVTALFTAVFQTIIVLCMSYTLSRFRFKMRKVLMKFMLVLTLFPGMLTMIILYRVLADLGLTKQNAVPGLILVYIASSGMGYYVSKGFFDTIPKSLDEAARVDGATRFQVLWKIILPLSKPIMIYTILTAFMAPWGDFVFARYISVNEPLGMNVAVGLNSWLSKDQVNDHYTQFCTGGVLVAIPVTILFMCLQKYYVEGVTGGAVKG